MGANVEVYKFVQNLRALIKSSIQAGCPIYAIELVLKDVLSFEVDPLLKKTIQEEAQFGAEKVGEPLVTVGEE